MPLPLLKLFPALRPALLWPALRPALLWPALRPALRRTLLWPALLWPALLAAPSPCPPTIPPEDCEVVLNLELLQNLDLALEMELFAGPEAEPSADPADSAPDTEPELTPDLP